jgi:uncharacterized protein (TIRG00374 family)
MIMTAVKLILTLVLLVVAFRLVDAPQVGAILSSVNVEIALLGVIFQLASTTLAAYRWSLIMQALEFKLPFSYYLTRYFKGTFFNQALPGSIGGDAVRVIELGSLGYSKKEGFFGVFIDRIVGLAGLLLLNISANLFNDELLPGWLFHLINLIAVGGIFSFFVLIILRKIPFMKNNKATALFVDLSHRFRQVYHNKQSVIVQLSLSVMIHFLTILALYELARAVGMRLTLDVFLVVVPPVFLLMLIPISLAGWGLRESAMVGLFMLIGQNKEMILSISILYGVMLLVCSLPGLAVWVRGKKLI